MNDRSIATTPIWLLVGGLLSLGTAVVIVLGDPNAVSGAYLAVMALISAASALGSRIGWSLLLLIAVTILVEFLFATQSVFVAALWGGIAIALLMPSSVRFVWRGGRQLTFPTIPVLGRYWSTMRAAIYSSLVWLAQWEASPDEKGVSSGRSFGVLLWRLGYCCAGLLFAYVVAFNMQSCDQAEASVSST